MADTVLRQSSVPRDGRPQATHSSSGVMQNPCGILVGRASSISYLHLLGEAPLPSSTSPEIESTV